MVWILGEWGGRILTLGGLRLLGFRGGALVAAVCKDMGIYGAFLVSCRFEKQNKTGLHFLGFSVVPVGWRFCPVDMAMGLRSFLALGWCLDGGDLGCGRGAVATWDLVSGVKKKF